MFSGHLAQNEQKMLQFLVGMCMGMIGSRVYFIPEQRSILRSAEHLEIPPQPPGVAPFQVWTWPSRLGLTPEAQLIQQAKPGSGQGAAFGSSRKELDL